MSEGRANEAANAGPPHAAGDDSTPNAHLAEIVHALLAEAGNERHERDPETLPRYAYFLQRLAMAYMQRTTGEARSAEEGHGEDIAPG